MTSWLEFNGALLLPSCRLCSLWLNSLYRPRDNRMLDKRFILENAELVQENCDSRGVKADVARFVELEAQRRKLQAEVEELSRQANERQQVDRPGEGRRRARSPQGRRPPAARAEGRSCRADIDRLGRRGQRAFTTRCRT